MKGKTMHNIVRIHPARIKTRDPFTFSAKIAETVEARTKGFQNVNAYDATMPIILQWVGHGVRLLHNEDVLFDVTAHVIDHKGYVQQTFTLKAGDPSPVMTSPCRYIIEVPEGLEITIENGDRVVIKGD